MLSRLNLRKAKSIGFYVLAWMLACLFYIYIRFFGNSVPLPLEVFLPAVIQYALLASLSQGIYEVFVLDDDRFHRSVLESTVMRTLFNLSMVFSNSLIVVLLWAGNANQEMIGEPALETIHTLLLEDEFWAFILYAFAATFLITFIRSINKKFGPRTFLNSLLGKYQESKEEERIFLFLDLKSATTLAEDLGHFSYSAFLRDYFRLVSNCCVENHGEVYQFAGDGVILTWTLDSCRKNPRPLEFYHDLVICFRNTQRKFERKYGAYPHFKAAIHVGRVIGTEVGNFGSQLAFHGDALNTTARLQGLCNLLRKDLLASETLVRKMPSFAGFRTIPQGSFQLKGKNRDLDVYSLE